MWPMVLSFLLTHRMDLHIYVATWFEFKKAFDTRKIDHLIFSVVLNREKLIFKITLALIFYFSRTICQTIMKWYVLLQMVLVDDFLN